MNDDERDTQAYSEQLYRIAFDQSPAGMVHVGVDGRFIKVNSAMCEIVGYCAEELVGMAVSNLTHPDDRARDAELLEPFLRGIMPTYENEKRYVRKDGDVRWVTVAARMVTDAQGRPLHTVSVVLDITARNRAQVQSLQSAGILRAICEVSPDLIFVKDRDGRLVFANPATLRVIGLPEKDVIGTTEIERVPSASIKSEAEAEMIMANDRRIMAAGVTETIEEEFSGPSGKHVYQSVKTPMRDDGGKVCGIVGVTRDITDQKRIQSNLRERQDFISGILGSITDGFGVVCKDWRFTFANDELVHRIGKQRDEILGNAMWDMFPDAVGNHAYVQLHRAMAERVAVEYEVYYEPWQRWMLEKAFPTADGGLAVYTRDITERKRVEQALADRTVLLNGVLEGTTDVIFVKDLDGRLLLANAAYAAAARSTPGQLVGKTDEDLFPPEVAAAVRQQDEAVIAGGSPMQFEETIPMACEARSFLTLKAPLRDGSSRVVGILGIGRDITASRRAENTVRASEARNSFLVTLTDTLRPLSDPITVQAEAGRVLGERLGASRVYYFEVGSDDYVVERDYTNAALSMVGRYPITSFGPNPLAALRAGSTTSEADVDTLLARTPEEKAAFAGLQIRSYIAVPLVKGGTFVAGLAVHADSVRAWTPIEIAMTEDTAERTWAAVERVRAEAALRASEGQRRLALDAAELGTWHVDVATRHITTDERFRAICGTNEEWTDYLQMFAVIHPDDLSAVEQAVAAATRPDDPVPYAIEHRVVHPDGAVRWVYAKGRMTHEEQAGKRVASFDGTAMDITARKLIEQEREQLVSQLREADRLKDEFLATLAHELRNPLAPLRNGLQMMQLAGVNGTVERARAMMDRQLTQLVRLVDDLMDVSRVTSGKVELRRGRVELRAVIDAAVETNQSAIEQAGHGFTVVVPNEPIFVDADAARLAQVVSNLLNNSAKYTHRGGHVRLTAWCEDGTAVLSVKDDGIGIPSAMLGRVFDMFVQVDRGLEKTTGGLGIGLSLVKGLTELHGGTVEATSAGEGMGSEFLIRLKVAMNVVAGLDRPNGQTIDIVPGTLRRILVVDDNVDAADSLGQLLEMFGNEVRTANDGEAGIAVAAQFRPDLVFMDIGMPTLNGYEAARRIRQQPWGREMVLVALTGWGQEDDRKKSANAGFDHHLVKPVDMDALKKLVSSP